MKKLMNEEVKTSKKQIENIKNQEISKSKKMVELFNLGLEVKQIAEILEVRYNFVYNVISNYININSIEVESTEKSNKKGDILDLYNQGYKKVEISKILKTNYNYVYKVIKEYQEEESQTEDIQEVN